MRKIIYVAGIILCLGFCSCGKDNDRKIIPSSRIVQPASSIGDNPIIDLDYLDVLIPPDSVQCSGVPHDGEEFNIRGYIKEDCFAFSDGICAHKYEHCNDSVLCKFSFTDTCIYNEVVDSIKFRLRNNPRKPIKVVFKGRIKLQIFPTMFTCYAGYYIWVSKVYI